MVRNRRKSNAGSTTSHQLDGAALSSAGSGMEPAQELGSMYDYLAKVILIGPSGSGKSCMLHRFLRNEWRALSSQTIGVEFGSKIVALGGDDDDNEGHAYGGRGRRTRMKLQLWDTAGTERFRAVSRSYYRGAAGAILVYDVADYASFAALPTFLRDARTLASPHLSVVLAGNKVDVDEDDSHEQPSSAGADSFSLRGGPSEYGTATSTSRPGTSASSLNSKTSSNSFAQAGSEVWGTGSSMQDLDEGDWDRRTEKSTDDVLRTPSTPTHNRSSMHSTGTTTSTPGFSATPSSVSSLASTSTVRYTGQQRATKAPLGREVETPTAARWASSQNISVSFEVSALTGDGVDRAFRRLAQMILTKIELGEIDPDDPQSGIQYGDAGWYDGDGASGLDDGGNVRGNSDSTAAGLRRRKAKGKSGSAAGLREWEAVFRLDRGRRKKGCC